MADSGDSTTGSPDGAGAPAADVPARREFLKATAAVTGASILAGCLSETAERTTVSPGTAPNVEALKHFEHIVVVMFENRSLDSLLGYLYQPGQVPRNQTYNGLAGNPQSNKVPGYINDGHTEVATRISPGTDADFSNPNPDPGEAFPAVNTQLFDVVDPPSNEFLSSGKTTAPYNTPPAGTKATMSGFVHDYCNNFVATQGRMPTFDEYRVIMDGFSSDQLPVLSTLAREFAVYDAWHAAVPTQTFCNRSFFHASASSGNVINEPYSKWLTNTAPTIFNRLQEAGTSWKIYYDASQIISLTGLIHTPTLLPYWKTHFAHMEDFYSDMANGTLPAYAFVEPRMLRFHNDYHPLQPAARGRVRFFVRSLRRARAGHRHFCTHAGEHCDQPADESRGADPHAVPEARTRAFNRSRSRRTRPFRRVQHRCGARPVDLARDGAATDAARRDGPRSLVAGGGVVRAERARASHRRPGDGAVPEPGAAADGDSEDLRRSVRAAVADREGGVRAGMSAATRWQASTRWAI
jgi:hypothetical protein